MNTFAIRSSAGLVRPNLSGSNLSPWAILDGIAQLVWVVDDEGKLLYANQRALEQTGIQPGCFAPWSHFLEQNAAWEFQTQWMAAQGGVKRFEMEAMVRAANNGPGRWHMIRMTAQANETNRLFWFGTATDIHDQRTISKEIDGVNRTLESNLPAKKTSLVAPKSSASPSIERNRRRSELLHDILNSLFEAIIVTNHCGEILLSNGAATQLLGEAALAVPATAWSQHLHFMSADGLQPLANEQLPITQVLNGQLYEREISIAVVANERHRIEARGTPLWDDAGQLRGTIFVFRDVTERRRMEQQLGQLHKLEAIGHLAAGIAHEINTPIQYLGDNLSFLSESLSSILGDSQVAIDDFLRSEIPLALEQSQQGVNRVAAIVRAMREFAAPGNNDLVAIQLNRAIENVVAVTRAEWKHAATIKLNLADDLPVFPGYPKEINQALYHLLINAIEAVKTLLSPSKGFIEITTAVTDEQFEISIRDNGIGIPNEYQQKIFDPFFTTKAPGQHSGQGLTIALAAIVKRHGGVIELTSEAGSGTCVVVGLPRTGVSE